MGLGKTVQAVSVMEHQFRVVCGIEIVLSFSYTVAQDARTILGSSSIEQYPLKIAFVILFGYSAIFVVEGP